MYYVTKEFEFASSHNLRNYEGPCQRVHGHNYKLQVTVKSEKLNQQGMVIDFSDLKSIVKDIIFKKYDHMHLNDVEPFDKLNPTAENMTSVFYNMINTRLPENVKVHSIKIWETSTSFAEYKES